MQYSRISRITINYKGAAILACRVALLAAILFWMSVIFGFSAEDGQESQAFSDVITRKVIDMFCRDYEEMPAESQQKLRDSTSFVVRKVGHFGEYAILGLLTCLFLFTFDILRARHLHIIATETFGVLYAVSDEVHQGFVDGRSPKVFDVCIDGAGVLAGIIFIVVIVAVTKKIISLTKKKVNANGYDKGGTL